VLTFLGGFGEADEEGDGEVCGSNFFRMGGDDVQKSGYGADQPKLQISVNHHHAVNMSATQPTDPLLQPLHPKPSTQTSHNATTLSLLRSAFPDPSAAQQIYSQKLEHKPLSLNPTTLDQREVRRQRRTEKLHRKRKPRGLSAREKRELRIYDIPKSEVKYLPSRHPLSLTATVFFPDRLLCIIRC